MSATQTTAPSTMTPSEVVTSFLGALDRLDIDQAIAYTSPDIEYQNVPFPPARGRAAFEKQMRMFMKYATSFEAQIHRIAENGSDVLTERTDIFRIGRFEGSFWVCGSFEVRDGQIVLWRDYFDFVN